MSTSIHNHDEFSFLDGYSHPKEMLDRAREIGLKGYAITNHGNQYSWVYYDKIKKDYPEIKMLYGVELYEAFDKKIKDNNSKYFHIVAIARNEKGRIALNKLVTIGNKEGYYYKPRIDLEDLKPYANDLVISTACLGSKIAKAKDYKTMKEYAMEYKKIFPYFFLEMQAHYNEKQIEYNKFILELSKDIEVPYIITTDSHRANKEDIEYQKIMTSIAKDKDTFGEIYDDCYLKSDEEIFECMESYLDKEQIQLGLDNSDKILEVVEEVNMPFQEPKLPHFPIPKEYKNDKEYLYELCLEGWIERGFDSLSIEEKNIRKERLDYEFEVIKSMGFCGYFLIVWDFINFAKNNDIMVGAGRGSAGGSILAYLIGITDIDPIVHGLIFERFLNPERISYPDIDVDVSDRETIISYLENKYGENSVCQVSNFSEITPKVAFKDVARALRDEGRLQLSHKRVEDMAKLFSENATFEESLKASSKLRGFQEKYPLLFNMAEKVSGRVRHSSIHACAIGIVDTEITDYMGMTIGENGEKVIQVDKRILEEIGIVKIDILGVTTLSVVKETLSLIGKTKEIINPNNKIFLEDKKMFELLKKADTVGIFQVESYGMQDLLRRVEPEDIGDISAVIALYRPDTMDLIEDYIERKHGREPITYIHEDMKPILEDDYGCMTYQEELLEIVRVFGGRSYGGADLFRKGIGKKDKELVEREANKLYQEIIDNGYEEKIAKTISEDLAQKGGYSFNKSHSIGYAVLVLQTAYLKANYPHEFMTALLNSCISKKNDKYSIKYKKLPKYILDTKQHGIEVLPPDINYAKHKFTLRGKDIVFGFMLVKNIGQQTTDEIVTERELNGNYSKFSDFVSRTNVGTSNIIWLIKAGAFCEDSKKISLMKFFAKNVYVPTIYKEPKTCPSNKELVEKYDIDISNKEENFKEKRLNLLAKAKKIEYNEKEKERYKKHLVSFKDKCGKQTSFWEYEALSMFVTTNPLEKYEEYLTTINDVEIGSNCTIIGTIASIDKKKGKNNSQYAFIDFYTCGEIVELISWHDTYKVYSDYIKKDEIIVVQANRTEVDKFVLSKLKPFMVWKNEKEIS